MKKGIMWFFTMVVLVSLCAVGTPSMAREEVPRMKVGFIAWNLAHTVPAAWNLGMKREVEGKPYIHYEAADGQGRADVQIAQLENFVHRGFNCVVLQAADVAALSPEVTKAEKAGTFVINLNLDVRCKHAGVVTMSHYESGQLVAKMMAKELKGEGNIVIIEGPPGASAQIERERGFRDEIKKYPKIKIVAAQSAVWMRDKAVEVMTAILRAHSKIDGVCGMNDSMAEGARIAAEQAGRAKGMIFWGNDGEKDALTMIEQGRLTGTIYTNCYEMGADAIRLCEYLVSSGLKPKDIPRTGILKISPIVVTKENVATIPEENRW